MNKKMKAALPRVAIAMSSRRADEWLEDLHQQMPVSTPILKGESVQYDDSTCFRSVGDDLRQAMKALKP